MTPVHELAALAAHLRSNRDFTAPGPTTDPAVRTFLETAVWPGFRASAGSHGREAATSGKDAEDVIALLTPGNPRYVLDEPGYHVLYQSILVTGRR